LGDEQIMVAAGDAAKNFHGLVRNNETAAFIVDCLRQETSEEAIVNAMLEEYDAPRNLVEQDVRRIISELQSIGALA
jgi:hypothetical protein